MVPLKRLPLKDEVGDDAEDNERDDLLDDLELHQAERASVAFESNTVGGYLAAILEEGDGPREGNDANEWPMAACAVLLQFKMAVPSKRHKDIAGH